MVGERVGLGGFGPMPVGTPEQVADVMEKWFVEGDIDGFNISCKSILHHLNCTIVLTKHHRHEQS